MMIRLCVSILVLCIIACNNVVNKKQKTPPISTEKLDTVYSNSNIDTTVFPALFEQAFIKNKVIPLNKLTLKVYAVNIGNIYVTSGNIIACDPLHIDEYGIPFTKKFPLGHYPVQLSIATYDSIEAVAFARILFNNNPVVKWELALINNQKPLAITDKEIHGYAVDFGKGIFADADILKNKECMALQKTTSPLFTEMDKHYRSHWKYAIYPLGSNNIVIFSTALGDGRYATYIGYDSTNKPCRLLTDFKLFKWKQNVEE